MRSFFRDEAGQAKARPNGRESGVSTCIEYDFRTRRVIRRTGIPRLVTEQERDENIRQVCDFLGILPEAGLEITNPTARSMVAISVASDYVWTPEALSKAFEVVRRRMTPQARAAFVELMLSKLNDSERRCYDKMRRLQGNAQTRANLPQDPDSFEELSRLMDFVLSALLWAQRLLAISGPEAATL